MKTIHLTSALGLFLAGPLAVAASFGPGPSTAPASEPAPMLFYWRVSIRPDRGSAASDLLSRMTAYVEANFPAVHLRVLTNSLRHNDTVHWFLEPRT